MARDAGGAYVELIPQLARDFERKAAYQIEGALTGASKGLGDKFGKILGGALAIGGGVVVGEKLKTFFESAVAEGRESNKVLAQTQAVLKSTGGAAGESAGDIDKLATKLSNLTGIDDEAVAGVENLLLTFTGIKKSGGIFEETTGLVLDMSQALGQDTKSSAIQLGKALQDPIKGITALRRVGVAFTQEQQDQIATLVKSGKTMDAQKLILAEIKKEFGGSAAAVATPAQKMSVAWLNFKETIGKAVIPILDRVETFLADKLPGAADVASGVVTKAADLIARGFHALEPTFAAIGAAASDFFDALTGKDHGLASASDAFYRFGHDVRAVFDALRALLSGDSQGFAELLDNAFGNTGRFVGPFRDLGNAVIGAFDWLAKHPTVVKDFAIALAGIVAAEKAASVVNGIASAARDLPGKLNPANTELGKLVTNLGKIVSKTASVTVQGAQDANKLVQSVIDNLGKVKDKVVNISAKVDVDAKKAGQGLLDRITGFLEGAGGPAIGAALGAAFGGIDIGALAVSIGGAIATALAAIAGSPVLVVAAIVVAVAAVAALAFAFRDELGHFFTDTLPNFLGEALGVLAATLVTLIVVIPVTIIETLVEWVPKIVEAFVSWIPQAASAIGGFFASLPGLIGGFVVNLPSLVGGALSALPGLILSFFTNLPELLLGIILRIPDYFVFVFTQVLPRIIITALTGIPGLVLSFFTSLPDLIGGILGRVGDAFGRGWDFVNRLTGGKLSELTGQIGGAVNAIVGFFSGLAGRIGGFLTNVFSPLWEGFRRFTNMIIRGWNSLHFGIPEFDTHIPGVGKIGGGSVGVPQIPYLAHGGDVTTGGLAVVGDQGPELLNLPTGATVTPLENGAALGMGGYTVEVPVYLDGEKIAHASAPYGPGADRRYRRSRQ